jgi:hypothetical protein
MSVGVVSASGYSAPALPAVRVAPAVHESVTRVVSKITAAVLLGAGVRRLGATPRHFSLPARPHPLDG